MTLPPLPEPDVTAYITDSAMRSLQVRAHSDRQLEAYARAALAAVPAQPVLDCEIQPRPLAYPLTDYHRAGVDGPLHYTWKDKPHRLLYDLIAAVRYYAAPQAVPVPAWQPIETVPAFPFVQEKWFKTGPRYLLAERSRVFIGSYSYTERGKGRWQDLVSKNCEPTHWMPLPAAPKEQPHE